MLRSVLSIEHGRRAWDKSSACASAHGAPDSTSSSWRSHFRKAQEPKLVSFPLQQPHSADANHPSTAITSISRNLFAFNLHLSCISVTCVTANWTLRASQGVRGKLRAKVITKSGFLNIHRFNTLYLLAVLEPTAFYWFTESSELKTVMIQTCCLQSGP